MHLYKSAASRDARKTVQIGVCSGRVLINTPYPRVTRCVVLEGGGVFKVH